MMKSFVLMGSFAILFQAACSQEEVSTLDAEPSTVSCLAGSADLCDPSSTPTYDITFKRPAGSSSALLRTINREDLRVLTNVAENMSALEVVDAQVAVKDDLIRINHKIMDREIVGASEGKCEDDPGGCKGGGNGGGRGGGGSPGDNGDRIVIDQLLSGTPKIFDPKIIKVSGFDLVKAPILP